MSFSRFVCWHPERVFQVMNTQAEYAGADVFLAVHSHYPITLQQTTFSRERGNTALHWQVDPTQFLADFLSDREGYQPQVAVLGESGSGKSHFIHWLDVQIPRNDGRIVLTIPKTGTSLRTVLKLLLDLLPVGESATYREQLDRIGQHTSTRAQKRDRLISEIALAISADEPLTDEPDRRDLEQDLIGRLPHLFRDTELQTYWASEDTTISRLIAHIEEPNEEYERLERQRLFTTADLPLDGVQIVRMARPTQELLNDLRNNPEDVEVAVEIINRNLDDAIVHLLNFSGEELVNLMLDIRRYLRRAGKELVLLIEDFARMQGVDRALLQALIEMPGTGPDALCRMRWAMAATTGYYARLPATVQTRMTHVVDMDQPRAALGELGLERFASRYLNAARVSPEDLQNWYRGGATPEFLPNACEPCPHRLVCHATFGEADGRGLYPFNSAALRTMAERKNRDIETAFNPRSFVGSVLAEVLDRYPV